jgi:hypothetical protein
MRFLPNDRLRAAGPFGCLFAILLGIAMASVIFVGSVMGDCTPGPGCHDHDGSRIFQSLFIALPIIFGGAAIVWLVSFALRCALQSRVPPIVLNALLAVFTIAAVWFAFHPAFDLFFWFLGNQ